MIDMPKEIAVMLGAPPHKLTRQELLDELPSKTAKLLKLHPVFRGGITYKRTNAGNKQWDAQCVAEDDVRSLLALLEAT